MHLGAAVLLIDCGPGSHRANRSAPASPRARGRLRVPEPRSEPPSPAASPAPGARPAGPAAARGRPLRARGRTYPAPQDSERRRLPEVPVLLSVSLQDMSRPRACRAPRCPGSGAASAPLAARVIPAAACERHRIPGGQLRG